MELTEHYRHIFLYAKNWYKKTDTIEDMKKLVSEYTGVPLEHVLVEDIILVLSHILDNYPRYSKPSTFIRRLLEHERFSKWGKEDKTMRDHIISVSLSIIAFTDVGEIPFELGDPDPDVLPLRQ